MLMHGSRVRVCCVCVCQVAWCFGLAVVAVIFMLVCSALGVCELLYSRHAMRPVTLRVLRFSVSFPGSVVSGAGGSVITSPSNGITNINFMEADVAPVVESVA